MIRLDSIEEALHDFREGKMVIVVDDEDRENEGDLIVAAEKITPEQVNFMLKNARGVLCTPLTISRCRELGLDPQTTDNTSVLTFFVHSSRSPKLFAFYFVLPKSPDHPNSAASMGVSWFFRP